MSIAIAILIFCVIIIIHEIGHYITARLSGIMVEEFAIGMGPKIFSKKRGETVWSIRLFPIGGFCKMLGEDEENKEPRSFNSAPVWKRMIVISGGVIMNIILALIIASAIILIGGKDVPAHPYISKITPNSAMEEAGLLAGDKFMNVNGAEIKTMDEMEAALANAAEAPYTFVIERDGKQMQFEVVPRLMADGAGNESLFFGFTKGYSERQKVGFFESVKLGFEYNVYIIKMTYGSLVDLVTAKLGLKELSGPIGIVSLISDGYQEKSKESPKALLEFILEVIAVISANLAVMNFLPLPALDGGRMIFLIIEAIRRKPINRDKEGLVHFVGFVLLMIFAVVVAFSDVFN